MYKKLIHLIKIAQIKAKERINKIRLTLRAKLNEIYQQRDKKTDKKKDSLAKYLLFSNVVLN